MADEGTTQTESKGPSEGQASTDFSSKKSKEPAKTDKGQSVQEGTTQKGTQADEESFIDPKDLPPELMSHYKNMQRNYTKKMEAIKANKAKIDAYDAFSSDPVGQMQAMAKRMGYTLSRAQAEQQLQQQQKSQQSWEPKSWDEVLQRAEERALQKLEDKYAPIVGEVKNLRKNNLETFLDNNAPDWRQYEDEMMENLRSHPSLVTDPLKLYRLSVPPEVIESRATQKALSKLQDKSKSAQVGGSSSTTKKTPLASIEKMSFDDAVKYAKAKLAQDGIHEPGR